MWAAAVSRPNLAALAGDTYPVFLCIPVLLSRYRARSPQSTSNVTNMAGKMPMTAGQGEMGLPNFDFSALQNVLNVSVSG